MTRAAFEKIVEEAMAELPDEFQEHLDNVVVMVQDAPSCRQREAWGLKKDEVVYGFFDGTPVGEKGDMELAAPMNRIWVFQEPLEEDFPQRKTLIYEIQETVIHELGHHFGLDDDEIEAIEDERLNEE